MIGKVLEDLREEVRVLSRLEKEGEVWFSKTDNEKYLKVEQTLATRNIPYVLNEFKTKVVITLA